ncbi:hypothetical protein [Variovorax sp. 160MFSha2.1]|uniref:hypothetical protein n=1 Tax=Variovorax sp. 160MFSha2.1 TaxID=3158367 RepID=UPI003AAEABCB
MKYDFENDIWPDSERIPYRLMQWWTWDYCHTICRRALKGHYGANWKYADEYQHAFHESQWEFVENCPAIEALMFRVFLLVMLGGRGDGNFEAKLRHEISDILRNNDLEKMLSELGDDERNDFSIDLQLSKVNS